MKIISYALFAPPVLNDANLFEYRSYIRGFYFNVRMNNLLYPEWKSHVELDNYTHEKYIGLFDWQVKKTNNLSFSVNENQDRCKAMLWRMKPIFKPHVTHVICRDTDAITTYKEAKCVQQWLESGLGAHAINDNPAHGGLMGGMVGFNTAKFKGLTGFNTWDEMINCDSSLDYKNHGADQNFLNKFIYPKIKSDLFLHRLSGSGIAAQRTVSELAPISVPNINRNLWESDLTCRHIGSAGVVEMETLRFFQRFDPEDVLYKEVEKRFPEIFYWRM